MSRRHEQRAFAILERLIQPAAIQRELAVPHASRFIDGLVVVADPDPGWGPLAPLVGHRLLVVEHYARPPALPALARARAKHALVVDAWWEPHTSADLDRVRPWRRAGRDTDPIRPPMLLILSAGRPRAALAALPQFRPAADPAILRACDHALGDAVLVHLRGLPPAAGTSALRLIPMPRSLAEAAANLDHLLRDSALLQSTRDSLLEGIMNRTIPTTDHEQSSIVDRLRREGRQEGRRDALLRLAERLLGRADAAELARIDDLDQLEAALHARIANR